MMRLLYLSAHSVLEFDEVSLFRELGHYVFSPGAYVNPRIAARRICAPTSQVWPTTRRTSISITAAA
jgi:hypothetical protein